MVGRKELGRMEKTNSSSEIPPKATWRRSPHPSFDWLTSRPREQSGNYKTIGTQHPGPFRWGSGSDGASSNLTWSPLEN